MITLHPVAPSLTVQATHGFEAPAGVEALVDELWAAAQAESPWLFDGRFFHLATRTPERLEGCLVPYRYWIAGRRDEALGAQLGLAPLAVTGITHVEGHVLLGRRSHRITQDAGLWELAPAGSLDGPADEHTGHMDVEDTLLRELHEELGVDRQAVARIDPPLCLAEDGAVGVFDIVRRLHLSISRPEVEAAFAARTSDEVTTIRYLAPAEIASFVKHERAHIAPVSYAVLASLA